MGCHFLPQKIFLTQGLNPHLLHQQVDSLPLSHEGSPLSNVALSFSGLMCCRKNPGYPKECFSLPHVLEGVCSHDQQSSDLAILPPDSGLEVLAVQRVSKTQAWQRTGRAGREDSGICYRLYTEDEFEKFEKMTVPEIQR